MDTNFGEPAHNQIKNYPLIAYPSEAKRLDFTDEQIEKADKTDGYLGIIEGKIIYLNKKFGKLWSKPY